MEEVYRDEMPGIRWLVILLTPLVYVLVVTWLLMALDGIFDDPAFGFARCVEAIKAVIIDWEFRYWLVEPLIRRWNHVRFLLPAVIMSITQFAFLWPVFRLTHRQLNAQRPAASSAVSIAVAFAVLLFALVAGLMSPFDAFLVTVFGTWLVDAPDTPRFFVMIPLFFFVMGAGWFIAVATLHAHAQRLRGYRMHDRLFRILLLASIVAFVAIVSAVLFFRASPMAHGSISPEVGLKTWSWVALWLLAPGIYLAATYKKRQLIYATTCERCGYAKGPAPSAQCPECGHAWEV